MCDVYIESDIMSKSNCLICYNDSFIQPFSVDRGGVGAKSTAEEGYQQKSLISKHLQVIFLLRNVFEIPSSQLSGYLRSCPKIEEWISTCEKCKKLVEKCKTIYDKLLKIKNEYRAVKLEMIKMVKTSYQGNEAVPVNCEDYKLFSIMEECRHFINDCWYSTNFDDPFIDGDARAQQEALLFLQNPPPPRLLIKEEPQSVSSFEDDDDDCGDNDITDDGSSDWEPDSPQPRTSSDSGAKGNSRSKTRKVPSKGGNSGIIQDSKTKKPNGVTCNLCGRKFYDLSCCLRHKASVHGVGKWKKHPCQVEGCGKMFSDKYSLRLHMSKHEKNPLFPCKVCGKGFYHRHHRKFHEQTHSNTEEYPHQCDVCPSKFQRADYLKNHQDRYHSNKPKTNSTDHPCPNCPEVYIHELALEKHMMQLHPPVTQTQKESVDGAIQNECDKKLFMEEQSQGDSDPPTSGSPERAKTKIVQCILCFEIFSFPSNLQYHMKSKHKLNVPLFCGYCGARKESRNSLIKHQQLCKNGKTEIAGVSGVHVERKYKCNWCPEVYWVLSSLKKHTKRVHKRHFFEFHCDICGQDMNGEKRFERHQTSCPTKQDKKPKLPGEAIKKGALRKSLKVPETEIKGEGEDEEGKTYCCEYCGASFKSAARLRCHQLRTLRCKLLHKSESEATKICDQCGAKFGSKQNLNLHIKRLHEKTPIFTCDNCGEGFYTRNEMRSHMFRVHKIGDRDVMKTRLFPCPEEGCGRNFGSKKRLSGHLAQHRGQPEFSCDECGKEFYQMDKLTAHKRGVHSKGEKVKCTICYSEFSSPLYLRMHMSRVHKTGPLLDVRTKYKKDV